MRLIFESILLIEQKMEVDVMLRGMSQILTFSLRLETCQKR